MIRAKAVHDQFGLEAVNAKNHLELEIPIAYAGFSLAGGL